MTTHHRIVILYPAGCPPADLPGLSRALESENAEVALVECTAPYENVLNAIEYADSVIFWR